MLTCNHETGFIKECFLLDEGEPRETICFIVTVNAHSLCVYDFLLRKIVPIAYAVLRFKPRITGFFASFNLLAIDNMLFFLSAQDAPCRMIIGALLQLDSGRYHTFCLGM